MVCTGSMRNAITTLTSGFWLTSYLLSISCTVTTPVLSESMESKAIFTSFLLLAFKSPIIITVTVTIVNIKIVEDNNIKGSTSKSGRKFRHADISAVVPICISMESNYIQNMYMYVCMYVCI